jgi:hypothetical protein
VQPDADEAEVRTLESSGADAVGEAGDGEL